MTTTTHEETPEPILMRLFSGLKDPDQIPSYLDGGSFRRAAMASLLLSLLGSMAFGVWTGLYALTLPQMLASALKMPILLIGTTAICFPSFFVIQHVLSPKALSLRAALLLKLSALAIIAATWAVVALPCSLFIANAQNYAATKFLVTMVAAFGGAIGMIWFARGYRRASSNAEQRGRVVFLLPYCVLFGLVGAQLAWTMRPFIGSPSQGFSLFRSLGGSLLENLLFS
jgi:hypothetical protein